MTINIKPLWTDIQEELSAKLDQPISIELATAVSGGDISKAYILQTKPTKTPSEQSHHHASTANKFFVKVNQQDFLSIFEAEARALDIISTHLDASCPTPLVTGTSNGSSFIVMQYLNLSAHSRTSPRQLGELIAKLHSVHNTDAEHDYSGMYGWHETNYIGQTPQYNTWTHSWAEFFVEQRLKPQFKLAKEKGFHHQLSAISSEIFIAVESILQHHQPQASLLHGDLWGGNAGYDDKGKAWIYDPASYYGDPETDIAMTELFGGFSKEFYDAYYAIIPQQEEYLQRKTIYNLYHMLNHLNLFGSGYLAQVQRYIKLILS
ncbi:hypothetical protein TDB9533_01125 [Thalassocella blandensis]|nr:hypothetical protein TDB9533_01125 [Thalassocella blandensis]